MLKKLMMVMISLKIQNEKSIEIIKDSVDYSVTLSVSVNISIANLI